MNGDNQGACVPCKELLCSRMAAAMIETGHRLAETGKWREADMQAWNGLLDRFAAEAKAMIEAGPLATTGRGSSAPVSGRGGEDWQATFRESCASYEAFVLTLPAEEHDEALRAGRDALDQRAVELAAARRGLTVDEFHRESIARRMPLAGAGTVGVV